MIHLLHKVRLAAAVLFLVGGVFITAMWVRSYRAKDIIYVGRISMGFATNEGAIIVVSGQHIQGTSRYSHVVVSNALPTYQDDLGKSPSNRWFRILRWNSGLREIFIPMWFASAVCWIAVTMLSLRKTYSLRLLFLAFTLVAVLLGLAIWLLATPNVPHTSSFAQPVGVAMRFSLKPFGKV
jgi:hypothetical protein